MGPGTPSGQRASITMQAMDPQFVSFDRVPAFQLAERVTAKALFGEGAMLNLVELEPGAVVARHRHPHEQLGLVLRGSMTLKVDGADHLLHQMDGYTLPGDVEHGATAGPEGALVLDVFRPVREDYRQAAGT